MERKSTNQPKAIKDNLIYLENNNLYNVLNKEIKQEITVKIEEMDPEDFETDLIIINPKEDILHNKKVTRGNDDLYEYHVIKDELLVVGPEIIQQTSSNFINTIYRKDLKIESKTEHLITKSCYMKGQEIKKLSNNPQSSRMKCKFCCKRFPKTSNLKRHQDYHCKKNEAKQKNNERLKYGAYSHPFICDYCKKSYTHKNTLITHIKSHLYGPRKYACEECNKKYTKKHNLTCHMKSVHLNIKSYRCKYCWHKFAWRFALINHEKTQHKKMVID